MLNRLDAQFECQLACIRISDSTFSKRVAIIFANTGSYGDRGPPLKIKILKIGLSSDLSWPKLGLEPKFHDPGTFGGFGKREHTILNCRKIKSNKDRSDLKTGNKAGIH